VYDTSTLNVNNNNTVNRLNAYEQSTVNVYNGSYIARLNMYDNSQANIYGGDYSLIQLFTNSTANLYGALSDVSFIVEPDAQVNVYGSYLDYTNGWVTGIATDGLNYSFKLQAVDINGSFINTAPTNVALFTVPIPTPLILFFSGLMVLARFVAFKGNLFCCNKQLQAAAT
jgi:hypothetical protein